MIVTLGSHETGKKRKVEKQLINRSDMKLRVVPVSRSAKFKMIPLPTLSLVSPLTRATRNGQSVMLSFDSMCSRENESVVAHSLVEVGAVVLHRRTSYNEETRRASES